MVFAALADLELQAAGLELEERVGQVESLSEAAYAEVSLASRLQGSLGSRIRAGLVDGAEVNGRLTRAGVGWLLLDSGSAEWLVPLSGAAYVGGLGSSAVPESMWPLTARLSAGSVLRRLARERRACVLRVQGGIQLQGALGRVGADFVTVTTGAGDATVPLGALVAVQGLLPGGLG
jgi:hypothetical protein